MRRLSHVATPSKDLSDIRKRPNAYPTTAPVADMGVCSQILHPLGPSTPHGTHQDKGAEPGGKQWNIESAAAFTPLRLDHDEARRPEPGGAKAGAYQRLDNRVDATEEINFQPRFCTY